MSYPIHRLSKNAGTLVTQTQRGFFGLDTGGGGYHRPAGRAADTLNLIWEGEALRRRPGCAYLGQFTDPVYGIFAYGNQFLIHAGTHLILCSENGIERELFSEMNPAPSRGVIRRQQVEERRCEGGTPNGWFRRNFEATLLFLSDGKNYLFYDGEQIRSCIDAHWGESNLPEHISYYSRVPVTSGGKSPIAGGDADPRGDNLLSQFRTESFCVDTEGTQTFPLNISRHAVYRAVPPEIRVRDHNGIWRQVDCMPVCDFVADEFGGTRISSEQTFAAGIKLTLDANGRVERMGQGDSTVANDGMDNVTVTYGVLKEKPYGITAATAMGLFGPDGSNNVLFLGGSAQTPGVDYFSQPEDFLFFYETSREHLGNEESPITGYCPLKDGRLAVLKNDPGESSVYFRSHRVVELGMTLAGEPYRADAYPSVAGAAVEGCISAATVGRAGNEPCFLTNRGVYTVRSVSDELINLNETLLRSRSVEEWFRSASAEGVTSVNWQDWYLLFFGDTALVTDGRTDEGGSYRFMKWKLPLKVTSAHPEGGVLYLGGEDGSVYRMGQGQEEAFEAFWQTPPMAEEQGMKMIFQRLELLMTGGAVKETVCAFTRNGKEGRPRSVALLPRGETRWLPVATRFGTARTLALCLWFPQDPAFRLWGIRTVFRKGQR